MTNSELKKRIMGYNNPAFVGDDSKIASTITVAPADEVTRSPNEFAPNGTTNGRTDTVNTIFPFQLISKCLMNIEHTRLQPKTGERERKKNIIILFSFDLFVSTSACRKWRAIGHSCDIDYTSDIQFNGKCNRT